MDFYNDAISEAKKQNIELSEECKEMFLMISKDIQDMTLKEKRDFLKKLICMMEYNWKLTDNKEEEKHIEIKVKTIFLYKNRRPYMAYDVDTDEYSLVMNPTKDMRNIKRLMKSVKTDIKNKIKIMNGIDPVVNFYISDVRYV